MQNLSPQPYFGLSSNTTGVTGGHIKQFTSTKTSQQPNKYHLRYTCCLKLNFNHQSSSPSDRSSIVQFQFQPSRHDRQGVPSTLHIYVQGGYSLDESTPNRRISFTASGMYILEPLDRLAYAATAPIKGRDTNIASLPFPLTICKSVHN
jgi:hypothetical protein